jgi:response regulator RpfG family c-di-GMP phosphodiesterase
MEAYQRNNRILYVDDEGALLSAFTALLRKEAVELVTLQDSTQIEQVLAEKGPFAAVFSDQRMPGLDGVGVLEAAARVHPASIRIMITGFADHNDTMRAINIGGITSYIAKPWNDNQLKALVRESVYRYNLAGENTWLLDALKTANGMLKETLDGTVTGTVRLLGDMIQTLNPEAGTRATRIRQLGRAFLDMMPDVSDTDRREITIALDLAFLGVAALPPWIQVSLNKQGLSSLERFPAARGHHLIAAGLVKDIPGFENIARILRLLNKNFDGSGEPTDDFSAGEKLPLGARMLHILVELDKKTTEQFRGREILDWMLRQPAMFDTNLINRMLKRPEAQSTDASSFDLGIEDLKPGMVLLEDVLSSENQCLMRAGTAMTVMSINILKQWHAKDPLPAKMRVKVQA